MADPSLTDDVLRNLRLTLFMERENLKIIIVGHVDHGKSTLIGRLLYDTNSLSEGYLEEIKKTCDKLGKPLELAFILDHLQEEREQGITIDTTQFFFKTKKRNYVIIDAPGHKEFIKNMVTGASQAEAAMIIIDAKEGIQEQTQRHAYILSLLGLKQIILLINKMDMVNYSSERFKEIKKSFKTFLRKINLNLNYIIPISAKEGDNIVSLSPKMHWYQGPTVVEALGNLKASALPIKKSLRYLVQDVYKVGDKRIIAGRVEAGKIQIGDKITFLLSNKESTVKTIEIFLQKDLQQASAGQNIGITITDPLFIERGEVISGPLNKPQIVQEFKASILWMSKEKLKRDETIILHCATQEVKAKIVKIIKRIDSSTLKIIEEEALHLMETEIGEVIIQANNPLVIEKFNILPELGRFVLVRNCDVVAGGIISN
ncbi:MAG: GTP-binding protein [Candidatus Doudnabacteria bacterium]